MAFTDVLDLADAAFRQKHLIECNTFIVNNIYIYML